MYWNKLSYDIQKEVVTKLTAILKIETDPEIQEGILAAIEELETWSNSYRIIEDEVGEIEIIVDVEYDPFYESGW